MEYYCGIDIGASSAKLVIIDCTGRRVGTALRRSGVDYAGTAARCLDDALRMAGMGQEQVRGALATGYGRDSVAWAGGRMTEIACHGKGAYFHHPKRMTVIDIGAQDSKVIHLDAQGRRTSYKMNRKCAAGTGAFLEEIALRLDIPLAALNGLAERSTRELTLGSFCTVFAATEVLAKIRAGEKAEDIVKGAFRSVARRILEMDTFDAPLVLTGGVVAHNPILAVLVAQSCGKETLTCPEPQYAGALGAALFALERAQGRTGFPACPDSLERLSY
ncbi:MAG: acyl-CoA dehydratase activase [Planctomycetota bacterium]